jgi:hypothetical protein
MTFRDGAQAVQLASNIQPVRRRKAERPYGKGASDTRWTRSPTWIVPLRTTVA